MHLARAPQKMDVVRSFMSQIRPRMSAIIIQPSTQAAGTLQADAIVYDSRWGKYLNSARSNVQIGLQSSDSSVTSYFRCHP
jgi:hypothetical protein